MIIIYYLAMLAVSLICSGIYFWKWHKHFDIIFTLCYVIFPLAIAGYLLQAVATDTGSAIMALKISYFGGCFSLLLIMLLVLSLCHISTPRWVTFCMVAFSTVLYCAVLSIGYSDIFYLTVSTHTENGLLILDKEYGWAHTLFDAMIVMYIGISVVALVYAFSKKPDVSRVMIVLLFLTELSLIIAFFGGKAIRVPVELTPVAYVINSLVYLIIVDRICLYHSDEVIMDSFLQQSKTGFVSFDSKRRFLGCNEAAKSYLPSFGKARVDQPLTDELLRKVVDIWLDDFISTGVSREQTYERNTRIYTIKVVNLYDGKRKRGYQLTIQDETEHREYLSTIKMYNENLRSELVAKTELIEALRERLDELEAAEESRQEG